MQKDEILVVHGQDGRAMARAVCAAADLAAMIGDKNAHIGLKPNLVVARPADGGATTHPEVVEGVICHLKEAGFANIAIMEGSWVGDRTQEAFRRCGYTALAKRYGVELVDTQQDSSREYDCKGMQISICDAPMSVDFMINLPVMKGHCQTSITCALKNNKGVIPNAEKRRFHQMGLHKPIAHLNTVCKNNFILVDAICGDLDFEEGGNPVVTNRLFAAADPVLCDAFAAQQMGYDVREVPYIGMAEALGVGSADVAGARVRQLNEGTQAGKAPKAGGKARRLTEHVQEDSACSACYAAVIRALSRMEAGELRRLQGRVCVGQGFQGRQGDVGVGRCCAQFANGVPGCPPAAGDILDMLRKL